jgi:hypothetical protein
MVQSMLPLRQADATEGAKTVKFVWVGKIVSFRHDCNLPALKKRYLDPKF